MKLTLKDLIFYQIVREIKYILEMDLNDYSPSNEWGFRELLFQLADILKINPNKVTMQQNVDFHETLISICNNRLNKNKDLNDIPDLFDMTEFVDKKIPNPYSFLLDDSIYDELYPYVKENLKDWMDKEHK